MDSVEAEVCVGFFCEKLRIFHHLEIGSNTALPEPPGDTKDLLSNPN